MCGGMTSSLYQTVNQDILDTWMSVLDLTTVMRGELAQRVLQCLFSDEKVVKALAVAQHLRDIQGGKAPEGLLVFLKGTLGAHMKSHVYMYQQEINSELAHIARIQQLKSRGVALIG